MFFSPCPAAASSPSRSRCRRRGSSRTARRAPLPDGDVGMMRAGVPADVARAPPARSGRPRSARPGASRIDRVDLELDRRARHRQSGTRRNGGARRRTALSRLPTTARGRRTAPPAARRRGLLQAWEQLLEPARPPRASGRGSRWRTGIERARRGYHAPRARAPLRRLGRTRPRGSPATRRQAARQKPEQRRKSPCRTNADRERLKTSAATAKSRSVNAEREPAVEVVAARRGSRRPKPTTATSVSSACRASGDRRGERRHRSPAASARATGSPAEPAHPRRDDERRPRARPLADRRSRASELPPVQERSGSETTAERSAAGDRRPPSGSLRSPPPSSGRTRTRSPDSGWRRSRPRAGDRSRRPSTEKRTAARIATSGAGERHGGVEHDAQLRQRVALERPDGREQSARRAPSSATSTSSPASHDLYVVPNVRSSHPSCRQRTSLPIRAIDERHASCSSTTTHSRSRRSPRCSRSTTSTWSATHPTAPRRSAGAASCSRELVLLDLTMPGMDGLTALPRSGRRPPDARSSCSRRPAPRRTCSTRSARGAAGYLLKSEPPERIAEFLRGVVGGRGCALGLGRAQLLEQVRDGGRLRRAACPT